MRALATHTAETRWVYLDLGEVFVVGEDGEADCDQCVAVLTEADDRAGMLMAAAPALLAAAKLAAAIRPFNWNDGEDPEQEAAWRALDAAIEKAEARP